MEVLMAGSRDMWASALDSYRAGVRKLSSSFSEKVAGKWYWNLLHFIR